MIVFRLRDAKSVMRSQRDDVDAVEMGGIGMDGSPDMLADAVVQLKLTSKARWEALT